MTPLSVADVLGPWIDPEWESSVIERCRRYWSTPVADVPDEVLATYLRQQIAPGLVIPESQRRISKGSHDGSEIYAGELADALKWATTASR